MYKAPIHYRPEIDGLRALAVIAVMLFHFDFSFIPGGFVGVDVFFVISGFLITRIISRQMAEGTFSFKEFYARRVRRIFPALFVMLWITSILAILFLLPYEYKGFMKDLRYAGLQIANIHFADGLGYFEKELGESPLLHTWSLGVEEQFYVVWPVLLLLLNRFGRLDLKRVLIPFVLLSFAVSQYLVIENPNHAFYMLYSRAWELAVGGLIALNMFKPSLNIQRYLPAVTATGLALILVPMFVYDNEFFPGVKALAPVLGAAMVIYGSLYNETRVTALLALKPFVFIGLISYSLYLWHWPVVIFYKSYITDQLTLWTQLAMIAVSLVLAYISFRFVEKPFRKGNAKQGTVLIVGLLLMVLTSVAFSNAVKKGYRDPWRFTEGYQKELFYSNEMERACPGYRAAHKDGWCMTDPNAKSFDILLAGDSHAIHYVPMVQAFAEEKGLSVRYIIRSSCGTWFDDIGYPAGSRGDIDEECMEFGREFYNALKEPSLKYVFTGLRADYFTEVNPETNELSRWSVPMPTSLEETRGRFYKQVDASFERMVADTADNVRVFHLSQVPIFPKAPTECFVKHFLYGASIMKPRTCDRFNLDYTYKRMGAADAIIEALVEKHGVAYFDSRSAIMALEPIEREKIYRDTNHLNMHGSKSLIPAFMDFMSKYE